MKVIFAHTFYTRNINKTRKGHGGYLMGLLKRSLVTCFSASLATAIIAAPTVFPTGTTIYDPELTWNGYTVLSLLDTPAVIVIDMNGNAVKRWDGFNLSSGGPARVFPDGSVIAPAGANPGHQESTVLIQQDFNGNEIWRYNQNEQIEVQGAEQWSTRQHHDWQRADFPAGYYSPDFTPSSGPVKTLLLTHTNHVNPNLGNKVVEADRLIEVSAEGEILWEWNTSDHFDEFRFDDEEKTAIRNLIESNNRGGYDWMHVNSATYVGPNHWYNDGDERFAPDNIILSSRHTSVTTLINREGNVVWQLGPDFSRTPQERAIGQVIGQHHAHFIPEGLPGAGNILIFDNGGSSGYGAPSPIAQSGLGVYARATSRIIEINPVTLERVWTYAKANFFSTNISSVQRLPNGNTLITEGAPGRIFEVTADGETVWEFMNIPGEGPRRSNSVYRAYRFPYSWLPQLDMPEELSVVPPAAEKFQIPWEQ